MWIVACVGKICLGEIVQHLHAHMFLLTNNIQFDVTRKKIATLQVFIVPITSNVNEFLIRFHKRN